MKPASLIIWIFLFPILVHAQKVISISVDGTINPASASYIKGASLKQNSPMQLPDYLPEYTRGFNKINAGDRCRYTRVQGYPLSCMFIPAEHMRVLQVYLLQWLHILLLWRRQQILARPIPWLREEKWTAP